MKCRHSHVVAFQGASVIHNQRRFHQQLGRGIIMEHRCCTDSNLNQIQKNENLEEKSVNPLHFQIPDCFNVFLRFHWR